MSLIGLSSLINQAAQAAPNPTPSTLDLSALVGGQPQMPPVPPSGPIDYARMLAIPSGNNPLAGIASGPGLNSPTPSPMAVHVKPAVAPQGTAASGLSGNTVAAAVNPTVTPPAPAPAAPKTLDPRLQAVLDKMTEAANLSQNQYNNVQSQIKDAWKNVGDLQGQIMNSPVPQLQKTQLSPLAALATLVGAGAMNSRFTPQSEQFVGNLLGGLKANNQTDYQNQMAQHEQAMQVLGNAVQSAKDQGNNLRYLLPMLARQPGQDLGAMAKDITSYVNDQQNNQTKEKTASEALASKQQIFDARHSDKIFDEGLKSLQEAPPEARPALIAGLQKYRPDLLGGLTPEQVLAFGNPPAKDQEMLALAHLNQIKANNIGGLFASQIAGNNAKAKLAEAQVDLIPHRMDLDDAHTQSYYKIISNFDAEHAATRSNIYQDEYTNRIKMAQAQQDQDGKTWNAGLGNEINIQKSLIKNAASQQDQLVKNNNGTIPTSGAEADAYKHSQGEIDSATRALGGLTPIKSGGPVTQLTKNVLNELYGGYYSVDGTNKAATLGAKTSQPQPGYSGQIGKGMKPGQGLGAITPPLTYLGQMKGAETIPAAGNLPLSDVLAQAEAKIKKDPTSRDQVIKRLKGWGVTVQ